MAAVIGVVLLGVFIGVALPALWEMKRTLQSAHAFIEHAGKQVDATLHSVTKVSMRLEHVANELEEGAKHAKDVLQPMADIAQSLHGFRDSLRMAANLGSAVGPAAVAAFKAVMAVREHQAEQAAGACCADDDDNGAEHASVSSPRDKETVRS